MWSDLASHATSYDFKLLFPLLCPSITSQLIFFLLASSVSSHSTFNPSGLSDFKAFLGYYYHPMTATGWATFDLHEFGEQGFMFLVIRSERADRNKETIECFWCKRMNKNKKQKAWVNKKVRVTNRKTLLPWIFAPEEWMEKDTFELPLSQLVHSISVMQVSMKKLFWCLILSYLHSRSTRLWWSNLCSISFWLMHCFPLMNKMNMMVSASQERTFFRLSLVSYSLNISSL